MGGRMSNAAALLPWTTRGCAWGLCAADHASHGGQPFIAMDCHGKAAGGSNELHALQTTQTSSRGWEKTGHR
eukprot:488063-Pelagomonas_calceolata.AAC.1